MLDDCSASSALLQSRVLDQCRAVGNLDGNRTCREPLQRTCDLRPCGLRPCQARGTPKPRFPIHHPRPIRPHLSPNVWWRRPCAPAPMPPTRSRCARSRSASKCATARSKKASVRKRRCRPARAVGSPGRGVDQRLSSDGVASLADGAVAMARAAHEDRFAGLADAELLTARRPISIRRFGASCCRARRPLRAAPKPPAVVPGVTKSDGASRLCGDRRHVCWGPARLFLRPMWDRGIACAALRDRGRRYAHGARLRFLLGAACRRPRGSERIGRSAGERTVKRLNPRKVETRSVPCGV